MEILEIEVTGTKSHVLPWDEIQIMPIGDVQLGGTGVQIDKLKRHLEWGMNQPNVHFIGMGDYVDLIRPSARGQAREIKARELWQYLADKAEQLTEQFIEICKGTEGRWLGLLEGHHFFEFEDGTTSDTRITQALKSTFLGTCAFVRLHFKRTSSTGTMPCTLWVHHGAGGGITPYSPLTRLYHVMHMFEADIYLIGHQSKAPAIKVPRIALSDKTKQITQRTVILAGTGSFMEGYAQGTKDITKTRPQGSYVERALLPPARVGGIMIKIRPVHGQFEDRIDLNVEV